MRHGWVHPPPTETPMLTPETQRALFSKAREKEVSLTAIQRFKEETEKHANEARYDVRVAPETSQPVFPDPQDLASDFHKRLVNLVNDFDATLDNEHEVGARLVSFGQAITFHVHDIGYWNPSLIVFHGQTDDGQPVELIQHVSQISVLLTKLRRKNPKAPKKPIGFSQHDPPAAASAPPGPAP